MGQWGNGAIRGPYVAAPITTIADCPIAPLPTSQAL